MRAFGDHFCGTRHTSNRCTPGDNGEGFRFIFRESAHPLVENGTQFVIVEAVVMEVFVGQFTQRLNSGDILRQATDLAVADGNGFHALFQRQQTFNNRHRVGHKRRDQGTGQRAKRLTVDANAVLFVQTHQTVAVLPVANGFFQGDAFGVRDVVGDTAAFVAGEATGHGDFCQQARIRRTVANLDRFFQRFSHPAAGSNPVIDDW